MRYLMLALIAIILIIIVMVGIIYLIPRLFPTTPLIVAPTPTPQPTPPVIIATPTPTPAVIILTPTPPSLTELRTFSTPEFTMFIPNNWGILTCANSNNFELDPTSNIDQRETTCSFAIKPVSVIIKSDLTGCRGERVLISTTTILRSVTSTPQLTNYEWCTVTTPVIHISHRVSSVPSRATSSIDYSQEIERIISNIRFQIV